MNITIIGAGGFGTTISILLAEKGHSVKLWANFPELAFELNKNRENKDFLPGFIIPDNIKICSDLGESVDSSELIIIAIPSKYFRNCISELSRVIDTSKKYFLSLTKGIDDKNFKLMSDVFFEVFSEGIRERFMVLSGPNLAVEIARKVPTSSVIAGWSLKTVEKIQKVMSTEYFRIYSGNDPIGVQIGGAYKNVIAIAAGICDGLEFGNNTKASLISRGLAEMVRFGVEAGALPHTFYGLSGMGDLVATSYSPLSRNRTFGEKIGRGENPNLLQKNSKMVIEGAVNVRAFYESAKKKEVESPIVDTVYRILYEDLSPFEAVNELMSRKLKFEIY